MTEQLKDITRCRICGRNIEAHEVRTAVFAGYSACGTGRLAHGECWSARIPRGQWRFAEDAEMEYEGENV